MGSPQLQFCCWVLASRCFCLCSNLLEALVTSVSVTTDTLVTERFCSDELGRRFNVEEILNEIDCRRCDRVGL